MSDETCVECRKPGTVSQCGVCEAGLCKKCRIFLGEDAFPFRPDKPAELKHSYYCGACHAQHVEPFREEYETTLEKAKDANVFYKGSKSLIRILKKADSAVEVSGSADRDETILYLAFQAVREGFSSLINVEVESKKVRNAGWQSSVWSGSGLPADVKSYEAEGD